MRPIHINAPVGTIVNPVLPAACGARGVVGYRVYDAVMGALAQVVPEKVIAPGEGGPSLIAIGGYQDGKPFVRRGARRLLGRAGDSRRSRGGVEPARQPVEPAGRDGRERAAAAGARLRARRRLGRPGASSAAVSPSSARTSCWPTRRCCGALRPALPPALRDRGRGGGGAARHDRRTGVADDADGSAELRKGDVFHTSRRAAAAAACRSSATRRSCSRTCSTGR